MDCHGCKFRLAYIEVCRIGPPYLLPYTELNATQGKYIVFRDTFRHLDLVRTRYVNSPLCFDCHHFGSGFVFQHLLRRSPRQLHRTRILWSRRGEPADRPDALVQQTIIARVEGGPIRDSDRYSQHTDRLLPGA